MKEESEFIPRIYRCYKWQITCTFSHLPQYGLVDLVTRYKEPRALPTCPMIPQTEVSSSHDRKQFPCRKSRWKSRSPGHENPKNWQCLDVRISRNIPQALPWLHTPLEFALLSAERSIGLYLRNEAFVKKETITKLVKKIPTRGFITTSHVIEIWLNPEPADSCPPSNIPFI
jgi:hypothetical protein